MGGAAGADGGEQVDIEAGLPIGLGVAEAVAGGVDPVDQPIQFRAAEADDVQHRPEHLAFQLGDVGQFVSSGSGINQIISDGRIEEVSWQLAAGVQQGVAEWFGGADAQFASVCGKKLQQQLPESGVVCEVELPDGLAIRDGGSGELSFANGVAGEDRFKDDSGGLLQLLQDARLSRGSYRRLADRVSEINAAVLGSSALMGITEALLPWKTYNLTSTGNGTSARACA